MGADHGLGDRCGYVAVARRVAFCTLLFCAALPALAQTCDPPVARVISWQGVVKAQRANQSQWLAVATDERLCAGDRLRTGEFSRAALALPDETVTRLDQNTVITFQPPTDGKKTWLEIVEGVLHIITRDRQALRVIMPFADAGIEGTEFLVTVSPSAASILVFEGQVVMQSAAGSATAASGEQVSAGPGTPPVVTAVARPRDAVQWTLYFPPVTTTAATTAAPTAAAQLTERASAALAVGRVEEAQQALEQALRANPANATALALRAIIALMQDDRELARSLADQAVAAAPELAAALIARSYVQQSDFDLNGALQSLEAAVAAEPDNALARARLAELWLALGGVEQAVAAAEAAVAAEPGLSLPHSVLGFAHLARVDTTRARAAFDTAIRLDTAAPLPRLGLGLALIREGNLTGGREQIEIAVILDPGNALIRSYIGKAYYDEKRDALAATQLGIAKELDPLDPTAYFYDAIRKQTVNRSVEALADLQQSVALNDNRKVYRSRLLLDQDLAARSAAVGRVYRDLGFEELALREGWRTTLHEPANFSGHRLLADTYSTVPRHEVARVNELLQSQLLQPSNVVPIPPQLGESNLFSLDSAGPQDLAFNEFNPLFSRDRLTAQGSGVVGGNDTWGNDAVVAGLAGALSFSLGQFHLETDGFRENNDLDQDLLNAFVQYQPSAATTLLAEARTSDREQGDLVLRFDPNFFFTNQRQSEEADTFRIGGRHSFLPWSDLLAVLTVQSVDHTTNIGSLFNNESTIDVYTVEIQHLYRAERWNLTTGVRYSDRDTESVSSFLIPIPDPPFAIEGTDIADFGSDSLSVYAYGNVEMGPDLTVTLGASADWLDDPDFERDRLNPKLGLAWQARDDTVVRAGVSRTLSFPVYSRQDIHPSLEPTLVGGFNQFFPSGAGEQAWRYGAGIEHRASSAIWVGAEYSERDNEVPFFAVPEFPETELVLSTADNEEKTARGYLYWTASDLISISAEYQFDQFDNDPDFDLTGALKLDTHRIPLKLSAFHPSGLGARVVATYVDQSGTFTDQTVPFFQTFEDSDEFIVVDAGLSYRLPKRWGLLQLEVKNALDESFRFQDIDPENPQIVPERLALFKATIAF